jgi:hypothetical protein
MCVSVTTFVTYGDDVVAFSFYKCFHHNSCIYGAKGLREYDTMVFSAATIAFSSF